MKELTVEEVENIYLDCLHKSEDGHNWVIAHGIKLQTKFEPIRLFQYRAEVVQMLSQLSNKFNHTHPEHGASFENMFYIKGKGEQKWTSDEGVVDKLLCLALAMGLVRYLLAREYWEYSSEGAILTFFLD